MTDSFDDPEIPKWDTVRQGRYSHFQLGINHNKNAHYPSVDNDREYSDQELDALLRQKPGVRRGAISGSAFSMDEDQAARMNTRDDMRRAEAEKRQNNAQVL